MAIKDRTWHLVWNHLPIMEINGMGLFGFFFPSGVGTKL
jgi:hypothetical protein